MLNKENINKKPKNTPVIGTYVTQPISQADQRASDSRIALPDDQNVDLNRDWIIENKL